MTYMLCASLRPCPIRRVRPIGRNVITIGPGGGGGEEEGSSATASRRYNALAIRRPPALYAGHITVTPDASKQFDHIVRTRFVDLFIFLFPRPTGAE